MISCGQRPAAKVHVTRTLKRFERTCLNHSWAVLTSYHPVSGAIWSATEELLMMTVAKLLVHVLTGGAIFTVLVFLYWTVFAERYGTPKT